MAWVSARVFVSSRARARSGMISATCCIVQVAPYRFMNARALISQALVSCTHVLTRFYTKRWQS